MSGRIFDLSGRSALVTGGSRGIGLEISRIYLQCGASVFLCARSAAEVDGALAELSPLAGGGAKLGGVVADVSVEGDAAALVREAEAALGPLTVLVNNAGVYGPLGPLDEVDWAAWAEAIHINLLGSALLAKLVLPGMKARGYGKIVQLSGGGATGPLPFISAYAASKAAVVRLAETLAEEVRPHKIDVNAVAPGALNTHMLDEVLAAGPGKVGTAFYEKALRQKAEGGTPLDVGAELCAFLASASSDGISGRLISAVWDHWLLFPDHRAELAASDVFTLRRITGRDRGMGWCDK